MTDPVKDWRHPAASGPAGSELNGAATMVAAEPLDTARLQGVVLVRAAVARHGTTFAEIVEDVSPLLDGIPDADERRGLLELCTRKLEREGLLSPQGERLVASPDGVEAALRLLGGRHSLPRTWDEALNRRLLARALGVEGELQARMKLLDDPEAVRAIVLIKAFGLDLAATATATAAQLRAALAGTALARTLGTASAGAAAGAKGLSPKAGRQMAARLLSDPRDPGTDRRLVAWLAAEQVGAAGIGLPALKAAILRSFVLGKSRPVTLPVARGGLRARRRGGARSAAGKAPGPADSLARSCRSRRRDKEQLQLALEAGTPLLETRLVSELSLALTPPMERASDAAGAAGRAGMAGDAATPDAAVAGAQPPFEVSNGASGAVDVAAFATAVQTCASVCAQGWSGDRKAFISDVWRLIRDRHPEWGISDVEFKSMLVEAHRQNQLSLAYADLKDKTSVQVLQASAVAYRNIVWHYIRVAG